MPYFASTPPVIDALLPSSNGFPAGTPWVSVAWLEVYGRNSSRLGAGMPLRPTRCPYFDT